VWQIIKLQIKCSKLLNSCSFSGKFDCMLIFCQFSLFAKIMVANNCAKTRVWDPCLPNEGGTFFVQFKYLVVSPRYNSNVCSSCPFVKKNTVNRMEADKVYDDTKWLHRGRRPKPPKLMPKTNFTVSCIYAAVGDAFTDQPKKSKQMFKHYRAWLFPLVHIFGIVGMCINLIWYPS
jgi:hypothetical protein